MLNKRHLHHVQGKLRLFRIWYLVVVIAVCAGLTLHALRQNNLQALRLRDKVLRVDEENGDIEAALKELRTFVYAHMNTDLAAGPSAIRPPIQLKYRYERLLAAEKEAVSKENEKIYTDAQTTCEIQFPAGLSGKGRIPCIQDYVAKKGITEKPIEDDLYKFDFVSPRWSPDLAGWSLVLTSGFGVLLVIRVVLGLWMKRRLSEHF